MSAGAHCHDRLTAGFTLLEMLVVLMIIAVVAGIAMPQLMRPSDGVQLQVATRDLLGALRMTRSSAISRGTAMTLLIDLDRRTFEAPAIGRKSFPGAIDVKLKVAEPERRSPSQAGFRFFPDGSSTGGDLVLRLRDRETRICVNWLTGRAEESATC